MKNITVFVLILALAAPYAIAADEIKLTMDDSGNTVELFSGQVIAITLETNPTTGYRWDLVEKPDEKVLKYWMNAYLWPQVERIGAGRKEVWKFRAVGKGSTSFKLAYFRSFEPDNPPVSEFTLNIAVK